MTPQGFAATALLLASMVAQATLYRCGDADDNRVFTPDPNTKGLTNCVAVGEEEASQPNRKAAKPIAPAAPPLRDKIVAAPVLITAGYLTGAADGCGVVPEQSNALGWGIALGIGRGNYGPPAKAQVLLNAARQGGIAAAAARKVDCTEVADMIRKTVHSMLSKSSPAP